MTEVGGAAPLGDRAARNRARHRAPRRGRGRAGLRREHRSASRDRDGATGRQGRGRPRRPARQRLRSPPADLKQVAERFETNRHGDAKAPAASHPETAAVKAEQKPARVPAAGPASQGHDRAAEGSRAFRGERLAERQGRSRSQRLTTVRSRPKVQTSPAGCRAARHELKSRHRTNTRLTRFGRRQTSRCQSHHLLAIRLRSSRWRRYHSVYLPWMRSPLGYERCLEQPLPSKYAGLQWFVGARLAKLRLYEPRP